MQPIDSNRDWIMIETTAIRFFLWLMLLSLFGVRCEKEIKIGTIISQKTASYYPNTFLSFYISYGGSTDSPFSDTFDSIKSGFFCIEKTKKNLFTYEASKGTKTHVNLNIATYSEVYRHSIDKYEDKGLEFYLNWTFNTEDLCFETGTWWPSGEEKNIEVYINFLSDRSSTYAADVIYLQSIVSNHQIETSLILDKNSLYEKQQINEGSAYQEATKNTKFNQPDLKVIGNIKYPKEGFFVRFDLRQGIMTYTGKGEFQMAFISKKNIEVSKAIAAIDEFAKKGSTPDITTPWAKVTSTGKVVEFTLVENNQRLLSEGTGKFGFSLTNPYLVI